ncbi:class I SAM-dependent methyltransferase [Rubrimonas cliftonensis]|uniref:Methyltransferase domain-containing protein n=1 Tax=Rubrimonas cliftonensis TaxID=89524 RepID=A0A1H4AFK8_9RHOB|nr:class I SAM-dependent methyltransferase [Rubrimonas cliftonensis]SEA34314.1 Methyltransferase domain-containing protein [Rubrimonas cliftonensis]
MDPVAEQYEAYPYPERDPADEAKRLVTGSPSHPCEIDHFIHRGARDWRRPFRALVAGGGTGDALVMMAQLLTTARAPFEIVYLDRSAASRAIAERRIAARGLSGVSFVTGDLLDAPAMGPFDYVDCCGVLHHLPDPQAGFDALARALAPGGGLGAMVYAPYGRTGVYPLQAALATLTDGLSPAEKTARARATLDALPPTNWLKRNELIGDHARGDAGLYDLLLHARDTPFTADAVMASVERAGLTFSGFLAPARYAPETWLGGAPAPALGPGARAALAEQLAGGIRAHVFYAVKPAEGGASGEGAGLAAFRPEARPRLRGLTAAQLAGAAGRTLKVTLDGVAHRVALPKDPALLGALDGRRRLGEIARALGRDWVAFAAGFAPLERSLVGLGALLYSETFP